MKSNAVRKSIPQDLVNDDTYPLQATAEPLHRGFKPEAVRRPRDGSSGESHSLRMYTEEDVSLMLQVSLSQLRKWRMKNGRSPQGPPFRKIGRLVRYPEQGLIEYINGK